MERVFLRSSEPVLTCVSIWPSLLPATCAGRRVYARRLPCVPGHVCVCSPFDRSFSWQESCGYVSHSYSFCRWLNHRATTSWLQP